MFTTFIIIFIDFCWASIVNVSCGISQTTALGSWNSSKRGILHVQPFEILTPQVLPPPELILKNYKCMNYPNRTARSQAKIQLNTCRNDGDVKLVFK